MSYKLSFFFTIIVLFCLPACSESVEKKEIAKAPVYVTNAQHVLNSLKNNKSSAVAFQVKPVRSTACEHMYIELGKKNAQGEWSLTNVMFPGKDVRDNFGQDELANQTHFAEVDGEGDYGVIGLGCKPYGREVKIYKGLFATFKVMENRLNYIGEIALIPTGSDFATVYIVNGTDFTEKQIRLQMPELEPFFNETIMEKYVPQISKEQQAALDAIDAEMKAVQPLLDMRNQVVSELNVVIKEWNNFIDIHGERSRADAAPEVKREFSRIFRKKRVLEAQLELHDKFIKQRRSAKYVKKYMSLHTDYEAKKEAYYVAKRDKSISESERSDKEEELNNARDVFLEFKDKNK